MNPTHTHTQCHWNVLSAYPFIPINRNAFRFLCYCCWIVFSRSMYMMAVIMMFLSWIKWILNLRWNGRNTPTKKTEAFITFFFIAREKKNETMGGARRFLFFFKLSIYSNLILYMRNRVFFYRTHYKYHRLVILFFLWYSSLILGQTNAKIFDKKTHITT